MTTVADDIQRFKDQWRGTDYERPTGDITYRGVTRVAGPLLYTFAVPGGWRRAHNMRRKPKKLETQPKRYKNGENRLLYYFNRQIALP